MGDKIVEGLWDCPYCETKQIGGLTKHCPCCGHPQDDDTKFYMGEKIEYLEDELASQYGQGADWVCPFCGSLNRVHFKYCGNCAAPKEESNKDYFTPDSSETPPPDQPTSKSPKKRKKWPWILGGVAALIVILVIAGWPRSYDSSISGTSWMREIDIESYQTVKESDWNVPDGGRVYDTKTEISHYNQVLDHYEERTREVSEEVYDGEDVETQYVDNGDGTFSEETVSTPRYRTEYHTETYQEPIYRDEPVYETKYYYNIDKWVTIRTEKSEGTDQEPVWPEYVLGKNEREGNKAETYTLTLKTKKDTYEVDVPLELWSQLNVGDTAKVTVSAGNVIKINDQEVG